MPFLLFILIVLSIVHFYVQRFIIPCLNITQKDKLIELRLQLDAIKKKSAISLESYSFMSRLLKNTSLLIEQEEGLDIWALTTAGKDEDILDEDEHQAIEKLYNTKNHELKEIQNEHITILYKAFSYSLYGWVIYLLPLLWVDKLKKHLLNLFQRNTTNWVTNIISYKAEPGF